MAVSPIEDRSSLQALREAREARVYDDGDVWRNIDSWHQRTRHVFLSPNTVSGERRFESLIADRARGGRVLDVGCGRGQLTHELKRFGARSVYGFDISGSEVEQARVLCSDLDDVSFGVHGPGAEIDGRFDLIVGGAILHLF